MNFILCDVCSVRVSAQRAQIKFGTRMARPRQLRKSKRASVPGQSFSTTVLPKKLQALWPLWQTQRDCFWIRDGWIGCSKITSRQSRQSLTVIRRNIAATSNCEITSPSIIQPKCRVAWLHCLTFSGKDGQGKQYRRILQSWNISFQETINGVDIGDRIIGTVRADNEKQAYSSRDSQQCNEFFHHSQAPKRSKALPICCYKWIVKLRFFSHTALSSVSVKETRPTKFFAAEINSNGRVDAASRDANFDSKFLPTPGIAKFPLSWWF